MMANCGTCRPALATPPRVWLNVNPCRRPPSLLRSTRLLIAGRALANMTQTDLASAAGIAVSVLQAIEQGKPDPKLSTVIALLDALKAQGVELLSGSDSVAWGVYVVPGSPAAAGGVPEPEIATPPQRKRRGRPPKSAAAQP